MKMANWPALFSSDALISDPYCTHLTSNGKGFTVRCIPPPFFWGEFFCEFLLRIMTRRRLKGTFHITLHCCIKFDPISSSATWIPPKIGLIKVFITYIWNFLRTTCKIKIILISSPSEKKLSYIFSGQILHRRAALNLILTPCKVFSLSGKHLESVAQ